MDALYLYIPNTNEYLAASFPPRGLLLCLRLVRVCNVDESLAFIGQKLFGRVGSGSGVLMGLEFNCNVSSEPEE